MNALVDYMEKKMGKYRDKNDIVFISHGDALEDAEFVRDMVSQRLGINSFMIKLYLWGSNGLRHPHEG